MGQQKIAYPAAESLEAGAATSENLSQSRGFGARRLAAQSSTGRLEVRRVFGKHRRHSLLRMADTGLDFTLAGSHRVQLVWEPRQADSASPIPFIRFVGPSTNW
jgi:hypothetical protein